MIRETLGIPTVVFQSRKNEYYYKLAFFFFLGS